MFDLTPRNDDGTDAIIVLKKDGVIWSEPSSPNPDTWTPNCQVVGVVYNSEPDQQDKVNELIKLAE